MSQTELYALDFADRVELLYGGRTYFGRILEVQLMEACDRVVQITYADCDEHGEGFRHQAYAVFPTDPAECTRVVRRLPGEPSQLLVSRLAATFSEQARRANVFGQARDSLPPAGVGLQDTRCSEAEPPCCSLQEILGDIEWPPGTSADVMGRRVSPHWPPERS